MIKYSVEEKHGNVVCQNMFRWLQIAYAYSKLYMKDEAVVNFIEDYLQKNYPNEEWVLASMQ